jgi:hypothetical protein
MQYSPPAALPLPAPACPCLPLPAPACPCLPLPAPACLCLPQSSRTPHCAAHPHSAPPALPPAPQIPYKLELVRFATDNDSIGAVICRRAEQLNAAAVVMAKHNKGAIREFFVGSVTVYCTHHCKAPLLIMHCD